MSEISTLPPPKRTRAMSKSGSKQLVIQLAVFVILAAFMYEIIGNTSANLARSNQQFSMDFLGRTAGFDIVQSLISYDSRSSYGRALTVGMLNTALVAALAIIASTVIGFVIGVMRLSRNKLASAVGLIYVETFRNIPLLLQCFIWYSLVFLQILPSPHDAVDLGAFGFLSNRGLMVPMPSFGDGAWIAPFSATLAVVLYFFVRAWARKRQENTGQSFPAGIVGICLVILLPVAAFLIAGVPIAFDLPKRTAFSFSGGLTVLPEFMALFIALSIYFATYIAEAVRAGIQAVGHGQTEAAMALGLSRKDALLRIVIPQAMRVIIPPLATLYMGVIKSSSLAVAIGYPDLVAIGGTVLNQTGKAIEIVLIWMSVYLALNLLTSVFMNWFNARMKLVER